MLSFLKFIAVAIAFQISSNAFLLLVEVHPTLTAGTENANDIERLKVDELWG